MGKPNSIRFTGLLVACLLALALMGAEGRPAPNVTADQTGKQPALADPPLRGEKESKPIVDTIVQQKLAEPPLTGKEELVRCGNLMYAGSKTSVCFSDKFMTEVKRNTFVEVDTAFTPVKLAKEDLFDFPFVIMTGEGTFSLLEQERQNLVAYLKRGGFLLASAGCSSREWDQSFRREFKKMFPELKLQTIPITHPIYQTVFGIKRINLKNGGTTLLEGLELDGRIVLIYSSEGLNDTGDVNGCCCCGGNEVKNSKEVNTNIFAYALTH